MKFHIAERRKSTCIPALDSVDFTAYSVMSPAIISLSSTEEMLLSFVETLRIELPHILASSAVTEGRKAKIREGVAALCRAVAEPEIASLSVLSERL